MWSGPQTNQTLTVAKNRNKCYVIGSGKGDSTVGAEPAKNSYKCDVRCGVELDLIGAEKGGSAAGAEPAKNRSKCGVESNLIGAVKGGSAAGAEPIKNRNKCNV